MRARVAAIIALTAALPWNVAAQDAPRRCTGAAFAALDFWLGDWDVSVPAGLVGRNRIEKILDGCAIEELWTDVDGRAGRSLFYWIPVPGEWRQVWVTGDALAPGGVKEKRQVEAPAGAIRFQGTIALVDGRSYLDRTTLTPLGDGRVRQHIEISTDGGATWRTTFDAVYVRARR